MINLVSDKSEFKSDLSELENYKLKFKFVY